MRYQKIDHWHAEELGVSTVEYLFLSLVYTFSTNPKAPVPGWCSASKKTIGDILRITTRTAERYVDKMSNAGYIIKSPKGGFLKTSDMYNTILLKYQNETRRNVGRSAIMSGACLLYTSPSPRDRTRSRMPSSA